MHVGHQPCCLLDTASQFTATQTTTTHHPATRNQQLPSNHHAPTTLAADSSLAAAASPPVRQAPAYSQLQTSVHIILHCAATTRFDERYDLALQTNTLGAARVAGFGAGCPGLLALVHVSTCYVNGMRRGLGAEEPIKFGHCIAAELGVRQ